MLYKLKLSPWVRVPHGTCSKHSVGSLWFGPGHSPGLWAQVSLDEELIQNHFTSATGFALGIGLNLVGKSLDFL